jgi:hypothetical protein
MRSVVRLVSLAAAGAFMAACTSLLGDFNLATGSVEDGGTSGAGTDAAPHATDGGDATTGGPDAHIGPDADACNGSTCTDPSTLTTCGGPPQACAFGCTSTGGAHCAIIYPTAPVAPSDLTLAGLADTTISQNAEFFTDTGAIENVRAANGNPLMAEVSSGIGFHIASDSAGHKIGVWSFKSLTIPSGVTIRFNSAFPAALVASNTITIVGVVDARGYDATGTLCGGNAAGPGGGLGGVTGGNGQGPGAGLAPMPNNTYSGGASGGSYGGVGGAGGHGATAATRPGANPGSTYGVPSLSPLLGGSGGGGAGAAGGGGGGAIQLVAGQKVIIGGGANPGGVNAGGCNGHGAAFGSAGSAGGSGGAILVETPALDMQANGVLAANGGAGAAGDSTPDPQPGQLSSMLVYGAIPQGGSGYGAGGDPGVGSNPSASAGSGAINSSGGGGSGGGSAGRIRINNLSGTFTPGSGAVVTPSLGITPNPPSSVGTLDVH